MKYKKSRYNYFVPYENNQTILYNFYSNYTSLFDADTLKRYNGDQLTDNEQEELYKRGFLVDIDRDELQLIKDDRLTQNTKENEKLFRVWTTSGCNARCFYCFEKGLPVETMTEDRCDDVIKYITKDLKEKDRCVIEWFGGEPLLNTKAIDKITAGVKAICKEKNVHYHSTIITNGSLITPEIVNKMENEWDIIHAQITLDGSEEAYNKIKNYYNPEKHNFKQVIDNILLFKNSKKVYVTIRLNYTEDNYEELLDVIRYLGEQLQGVKNINCYVYPIWSTLNQDEEDKFISTVQADQNLMNIFEEILKYNLNTIKKLIRTNRKLTSCKSCNINSCTILPSGKISKCSESFNIVYGDIVNGIQDKDEYMSWSTRDFDPKCEDCVYLPICQGGCEASKHIDMPKCFAYKPIIDDMLVWYVNKLQNK